MYPYQVLCPWVCPWMFPWMCPWMCPSHSPMFAKVLSCQSLVTNHCLALTEWVDWAKWQTVQTFHQLMTGILVWELSPDVAVEMSWAEYAEYTAVVVVVVGCRPMAGAQTAAAAAAAGAAAAAAVVAKLHTAGSWTLWRRCARHPADAQVAGASTWWVGVADTGLVQASRDWKYIR